MLRLPMGSWKGEEQCLDQIMGVMAVVTYETVEQILLPFAFLLASGNISVAQYFLLLPSGFFACKVQTKEGLLAQTTEECCCGALGRSWFMCGKGGAGAGRAEPPRTPPSSSALTRSAAPGSAGRNGKIYVPQVWILSLGMPLVQSLIF